MPNVHTMRILRSFFQLLVLILLFAINVQAQNNTSTKEQKKEQLKQLLESKNYIFVAQSAYTASGRMIQLTSEYFLKIKGDSLESHLPFFGVAFNAPFSSTVSPLSFISSDFNYSMVESKKGRFEITIRLNEPDDPNVINLSVSPGAYADLRVISTNRQAMSFYGEVRPLEKK
jgi:hypothetical protein